MSQPFLWADSVDRLHKLFSEAAMARKGRPRKRRSHTEHPGVKLKRRGGVWIARWVDPDKPAKPDAKGRVKHNSEQRLNGPKLKLTTDEARRDWAIKKSQALAKRRAALASGQATTACTAVIKAMEGFYTAQQNELKPSTLAVYREATTPFQEWADGIALACVEELTPAKLTAFRDWFLVRPAHAQAKGKRTGRGARETGKRKRSPGQLNKCIRSTRTVLNHWRKRGLTPGLTSDAIRDHLEFVKAHKPAPVFLRAPEIRALVEACQRHDADTFNVTRDGNTGPRYAPITPFVLAALLSGMRFAELTHLRWKWVDLEAQEIRLPHDATKTGHARTIGLRESPALAALLARLKLQAGGSPFVFGSATTDARGKTTYHPMRRDVAEAARRRLIAKERVLKGMGRNPHKRKPRVESFGAPTFTWHDLRRTCGTFLTCAPSIYGGASAFLSAKRLGHSVAVSEKHYAGSLNNIGLDVSTLEEAMGIADLLPKPVKAGQTVAG
jgi:integrase